MITLTQKQKQAFDFIKNYCDKLGYAPSYQEIADGIGLKSRSGVNRLVTGLIERGAIHKQPGKARSFSFPQSIGEAA